MCVIPINMQTSMDVYHRNSDRTEGGTKEFTPSKYRKQLCHPVARSRKPTSSLTGNKWQAAHTQLHPSHSTTRGAVLLARQGKEVNQMWPWKMHLYLHENLRQSFLVQLLSVQCYRKISLFIFFEKIIHNYIAQSSNKNHGQKRKWERP